MEVPTIIKYKSLTFLLSSAPNEYLSTWYINFFKKYNVKHIVAVSERNYNSKKYEMNGFIVHDLCFLAGSSPSKPIIKSWKLIVEDAQRTNTGIFVHCITGLDQAPVMVALSLIKMGLSPNEAIRWIHEKRRGCFNGAQIRFLQNYKSSGSSCLIM